MIDRHMLTEDDLIEAVAEAWASIDGKTQKFYACKVDDELDRTEGYYMGYLEDAKELIKRIRDRGVIIRLNGRLPKLKGPGPLTLVKGGKDGDK